MLHRPQDGFGYASKHLAQTEIFQWAANELVMKCKSVQDGFNHQEPKVPVENPNWSPAVLKFLQSWRKTPNFSLETYPSPIKVGYVCIFTLLADHLVGSNKGQEHGRIPEHTGTWRGDKSAAQETFKCDDR